MRTLNLYGAAICYERRVALEFKNGAITAMKNLSFGSSSALARCSRLEVDLLTIQMMSSVLHFWAPSAARSDARTRNIPTTSASGPDPQSWHDLDTDRNIGMMMKAHHQGAIDMVQTAEECEDPSHGLADHRCSAENDQGIRPPARYAEMTLLKRCCVITPHWLAPRLPRIPRQLARSPYLPEIAEPSPAFTGTRHNGNCAAIGRRNRPRATFVANGDSGRATLAAILSRRGFALPSAADRRSSRGS